MELEIEVDKGSVAQMLLEKYGPGDLMIGTKAELLDVLTRAKVKLQSRVLLDTAKDHDKLGFYMTKPDAMGHWRGLTIRLVPDGATA
jgi:hypothetical protein